MSHSHNSKSDADTATAFRGRRSCRAAREAARVASLKAAGVAVCDLDCRNCYRSTCTGAAKMREEAGK